MDDDFGCVVVVFIVVIVFGFSISEMMGLLCVMWEEFYCLLGVEWVIMYGL